MRPSVYFVKLKDPGTGPAVHEVKITDILMDNGEFCDEERQVERKTSFVQRLSMRAARLTSRFSIRLGPDSGSGAKKQVQVGDARTEKANLLAAGGDASYDSRPIEPGRTGDEEHRDDSLNVSMEDEPEQNPYKQSQPVTEENPSGPSPANAAVPENDAGNFMTGDPKAMGQQPESVPPFAELEPDHPSNSSQQPLIRADLSEHPSEGTDPSQRSRKKKKKKKKKPELDQQLDDVAEEPGPEGAPADEPVRLPPPNEQQ